MKSPLFLLCVALLTSGTAQTQTSPADSLTLSQAVALALANNPVMTAGNAGIASAEGGYVLARSTLFPAISASAVGTHTEGAFVFNPSFPPRDQIYSSYTLGITAQQTVLDVGKMFYKISASADLVDASTMDARSTRDNLILNVHLAYYGVLQAIRLEEVAVETQAQAEKRLVQAQAFFTVGKRPQSDVLKAEVDVANANVGLIRARNVRKVSYVQLENFLGVHPHPPFRLRDERMPMTEIPTIDSALVVALKERPDYRAAVSRTVANRALASSAWSQHLPTLSATAAYTWSNFTFPLFGRWNAGFTLSLPVFQGFAIDAQWQQAKAAEEIARAAEDGLRETVRLDVEQALLDLQDANESIVATGKLVEQAEQSLNLAERQYAAGIATALEVSDAQLTLSTAKATNIQALFNQSTAQARLLRSMGVLSGRYP